MKEVINTFFADANDPIEKKNNDVAKEFLE